MLREESDATLKEFRITLDEERAAQRDRLEAQNRRDIEHLKAESEEELQAERRRLKAEREEKVNSLKQEVTCDDAGRPGSSSFLISELLLKIVVLQFVFAQSTSVFRLHN